MTETRTQQEQIAWLQADLLRTQEVCRRITATAEQLEVLHQRDAAKIAELELALAAAGKGDCLSGGAPLHFVPCEKEHKK